MGRYLRGLIAGREQELLGFCATSEGDKDLRLLVRGLRPWPLWEQVSLTALIREYGIETFIAPYNTAPLRLPANTRLVLIVHDLIYFEPLPRSQSNYQNLGRIYRRMVVPRAVRRADIIVANSRHTAEQICNRFGVERSRVLVIPACLEDRWFDNGGRAGMRGEYLLAVTGEAPSKNLQRALEAFAAYRSRGGNLRMKVAGVKPAFHAAFTASAAALGAADAVEFVPYLDQREMMRLYRHADALLVPSLNEGFGIPVAEAMASGVPVVCSRAGSLPEVAGEAAEYFEPTCAEDMAGALQRVLGDEALRTRLRHAGFTQASRYHSAAVKPLIDSFWKELGPTPTLPVEREAYACLRSAS
jgi:glycosyltransferase involved in cell wall biosynthesis